MVIIIRFRGTAVFVGLLAHKDDLIKKPYEVWHGNFFMFITICNQINKNNQNKTLNS
jgi:hypothetical protein